jgi:hypothetical protein
MFFVLVKSLRRQDDGDDRHFGVQLNAHQSVDDARRHEFVPIDAAVHDESRRDHGGVSSRPREQFYMQGNFKRAGHLEALDVLAFQADLSEFAQESRQGLIDDVAMPARLHEGDARKRRPRAAGRRQSTTRIIPIHCTSETSNRIGAQKNRAAAA